MVPISTATTVKAAMVVISDITENRKLQWQAIRSFAAGFAGRAVGRHRARDQQPQPCHSGECRLLARIWNDALPILDEYEQEQGDFLLAGLGFAQARQTIVRGMNDIAENAKRIQKIVDNLKHLGKQDRGHMDELADIGRILHAVATLLDARIRKCTDRFALDLPDSLPLVRGNVQQLEQVFINVIVNALESLPDRSRAVRVSAQSESGGRPADRRGGGPGKGNPRGRDGAAWRAVLHHQGREWRHRARTVDLVVDRRQARRHAALRIRTPNSGRRSASTCRLPRRSE
jgi:signal transduction histidine kinase